MEPLPDRHIGASVHRVDGCLEHRVPSLPFWPFARRAREGAQEIRDASVSTGPAAHAASDSDRDIGAARVMGRPKAVQWRSLASACGWLDTAQALPDDEAFAAASGGPRKASKGILQADAFAGYHPLDEGGRVLEVACLSHARRKMCDVHERQHRLARTLAHQALRRIGVIFQIEAQSRGETAPERWRARQQRTRPALQEVRTWLNAMLAQVSAKSPMAMAIGYALSN